MVLKSSPRVPSNDLCVSSDMDQEQKQQLKDLLLNNWWYPGGRKSLKKLRARRFVKTGKEFYLPVFLMVQDAGIDLGKYGIDKP